MVFWGGKAKENAGLVWTLSLVAMSTSYFAQRVGRKAPSTDSPEGLRLLRSIGGQPEKPRTVLLA